MKIDVSGEINLENIKKNRDFLLSNIETKHKNSFFSNDKVPKLVAVSKKQDDYKIDNAIDKIDAVNDYLKQRTEENISFEESLVPSLIFAFPQ